MALLSITPILVGGILLNHISHSILSSYTAQILGIIGNIQSYAGGCTYSMSLGSGMLPRSKSSIHGN